MSAPPIHEQSVSAMKSFLRSRSVSYSDCVERADLVQRVHASQLIQQNAAPAAAAASSAAPQPSASSSADQANSLHLRWSLQAADLPLLQQALDIERVNRPAAEACTLESFLDCHASARPFFKIAVAAPKRSPAADAAASSAAAAAASASPPPLSAVLGFVVATLRQPSVLDASADPAAHDPDGSYLLIRSVCVLKALQRQGLGQEMLADYIRGVKEEQRGRVKAAMLLCSESVAPFFQRCGFTCSAAPGKEALFECRMALAPAKAKAKRAREESEAESKSQPARAQPVPSAAAAPAFAAAPAANTRSAAAAVASVTASAAAVAASAPASASASASAFLRQLEISERSSVPSERTSLTSLQQSLTACLTKLASYLEYTLEESPEGEESEEATQSELEEEEKQADILLREERRAAGEYSDDDEYSQEEEEDDDEEEDEEDENGSGSDTGSEVEEDL